MPGIGHQKKQRQNSIGFGILIGTCTVRPGLSASKSCGHLSSTYIEELWFSPDWKEYIWYCKKGLNVGHLPAKFDKYWKPPRGADIVRGHIAGCHPSRYLRIDKADVQTKINEDDVLMNGNQKATQWVVMNKGTADLIAVEIRGKVHIEVYPAAINVANDK